MQTTLRKYCILLATILSVALSIQNANAQITGASSVCVNGSTTLGAPSTTISGGTVTSVNGYNVHSFTSGGELAVPAGINYKLELLVVAGGGGGGYRHAGGGGAGGLIYNASYAATGSQPVVIGAGGAGANGTTDINGNTLNGTNGGNSSFGSLVAIGGGAGGSNNIKGNDGGSGGGGSNGSYGGAGTAGQGNAGGNQNNGAGCCYAYGNGGGGYLAAGANTTAASGSAGGNGFTTNITGSSTSYAGGGGGGNAFSLTYAGGVGGGGAGGNALNMTGTAGLPNTGGGGGGGGAAYTTSGVGGKGGSGIVIVKYAQATAGVWSSDNTAVATVNASTGVVTGLAAGTANISYTYTIGGVTNSATKQITVVGIPIASIKANGPLNFCAGGNVSLSAATYALQFNGSNAVNVANGYATTDDITYEATVTPTAFSGFNVIMNFDNYNTGAIHYQFSNGNLQFSVSGNSPNDQYCTASFTPNTTYRVAAVYSKAGKYVKFYVNGVLINTATYTSTVSILGNNSYSIGSWNGNSRYFVGTIDDIRVWNLQRTGAQLLADATDVPIPTGTAGLMRYYRFDEGTGTTTSDDAGNGNGTLINNPTWVSTTPAGLTYLWSPGSATSQSISVNTAGSYTVAVTNPVTGCSTVSEAKNIIVNPIPTASITATGSTSVCPGASVSLQANTGTGFTYQWNKNGVGIAGATSATYAATVTGSYSVIITSGTGCVSPESNAIAVRVEDVIAPQFTSSFNLLTQNAGGVVTATSPSGAMVMYSLPTAIDNCTANPTVTAVPASGSIFPIGNTTVTATATDNNGLSTKTTFIVTVSGVAPVIVVPANSSINAAAGQCSAITNFAATETTGIPASVISYTENGNAIVSGTALSVGVHTITATATNAVGTSSATFTITVNDVTAPTIPSAANIFVNATSAAGAVVTFVAPVGTDNCSVATTVRTTGLASGSVFPLGTTTQTYETTDAAGLTASTTFTVTVNGIAPLVVCPSNITVNTIPGECRAIVNFASTETRAIPASTITYSIPSGSYFPLGTTTVTSTATNAYGTSNCSFTVTVVDNQAPTVITKPATVYLDATGHATVNATDVNNGSNDNCSAVTFGFQNPGASGTKCVTAMEGGAVVLAAPSGSVITSISFASYGTPNGTCGNFTIGNCNALNSKSIVESLALNKNAVTIAANNTTFGDPCYGTQKRLYIQFTYGAPMDATKTYDCSNLGANTVSLSVKDAAGNIATKTETVTVVDSIKPVITAPANISLIATSAAGAVATYTAPVGTDNCSVSTTRVAGLASGSMFPIGTTTVTYTATDGSGLQASASFNVNVIAVPPVIVAPQNLIVSNEAGKCGASVSFAATETTAIPASTITYSENGVAVSPGNYFTVGTHHITATATNIVGSSSADFSITVVDREIPTAIAQPVTIYLDATGRATVSADQINNQSTDNCGINQIAIDKTAFDCSNLGENTVVLTVTDIHGNSNKATAIVTVVDSIAPVIAAAPSGVTVECNAVPAAAVLTATDNCTVTVSMTETRTDGKSINDYVLNRTWTATDASGNTSSSTQVITVQDTKAPELIVPSDISVNTDNNVCGAVVNFVATATDNCATPLITYSQNSGSIFPVGTTTVTVTAMDASGNTTVKSFTITVTDRQAPVAIAKNITIGLSAVGGQASITAADVNNGSSDACGIANMSVIPASFSCASIGANLVTLTVTDVNGNTSTTIAIVTVVDDKGPVPTAVLPDITGQCYATALTLKSGEEKEDEDGRLDLDNYYLNAPTAMDNCSGLIRATTTDPLTYYNQGQYIIHWKYVDAKGNVTIQEQKVIVKDTEAPKPKSASLPTIKGQCSVSIADTNNGKEGEEDGDGGNDGGRRPWAMDNCSGRIIGTTKDPLTYTAQGTYTIHWTYDDGHGNISTQNQTVIVADITKPKIKAPADKTVSCGSNILPAVTGMATATDNCSVPVITYSDMSSNNQITRTWKATDAAGNYSTDVQIIKLSAAFTATLSSTPTGNVYTGGSSTNLYLGYGAQSTTLSVNGLPSAGAPYSYAWSGIAAGNLSSTSAAAPLFSATAAGVHTFTVTITNKNGCSNNASISICVTDVRVAGSNGALVYVCHAGTGKTGGTQTLQVPVAQVPSHIQTNTCGGKGGDRLGSCSSNPCNTSTEASSVDPKLQDQIEMMKLKADVLAVAEDLKVTVMPNPTTTYFTLKIESKDKGLISLRVMDASGRAIDSKQKIEPNTTIQVGHQYPSGTFYGELIQGNKRKVVQMIKARG